MEYTVDYFIKKFEAIPEDSFYQGEYANPYDNTKKCALGHCGRGNFHPTAESESLEMLIRAYSYKTDIIATVSLINDGSIKEFQQPTPKQRILAALYDIRDKELSEANLKEASKIVSEEIVFENN